VLGLIKIEVKILIVGMFLVVMVEIEKVGVFLGFYFGLYKTIYFRNKLILI
jgi:hypothetical protein